MSKEESNDRTVNVLNIHAQHKVYLRKEPVRIQEPKTQ